MRSLTVRDTHFAHDEHLYANEYIVFVQMHKTLVDFTAMDCSSLLVHRISLCIVLSLAIVR